MDTKNAGEFFEVKVARYFSQLGYVVFNHSLACKAEYNGENRRYDNGIDLIAFRGNKILLIQCKWRSHKQSKHPIDKEVLENILVGKDIANGYLLRYDKARFEVEVVLAIKGNYEKELQNEINKCNNEQGEKIKTMIFKEIEGCDDLILTDMFSSDKLFTYHYKLENEFASYEKVCKNHLNGIKYLNKKSQKEKDIDVTELLMEYAYSLKNFIENRYINLKSSSRLRNQKNEQDINSDQLEKLLKDYERIIKDLDEYISNPLE